MSIPLAALLAASAFGALSYVRCVAISPERKVLQFLLAAFVGLGIFWALCQ
jgi:hypothetical protein